MTALILLCAMTLSPSVEAEPGTARFEGEGVQILVTLMGGQYTYRLVNLGASPIVRFEVDQVHTYNPQAPDGWQVEEARNRFVAWPQDLANAIHADQPKQFGMRVSSAGAVLGEGVARVSFADGRVVDVNHVWCPVLRPCGTKVLLSAVLAAIILAHAAWVFHRQSAGHGRQPVT